MIPDTTYLFSSSADLLSDVSTFMRSLIARSISFEISNPLIHDEAMIALQLEEDRQWKCFDC